MSQTRLAQPPSSSRVLVVLPAYTEEASSEQTVARDRGGVATALSMGVADSVRAADQPPAADREARGLAFQPLPAPDFPRLLSMFEPITLVRLDAVALMDRTDTKYVMSPRQLHAALAALQDHYWVLDIDGHRVHRYQTLYFDDDSFGLYRQHHAQSSFRYKVRSREYVETGQSFLEVKRKTKRGRTTKHRLRTAGLVEQFGPKAQAFLSTQAVPDTESLQPRLWDAFSRITLVGKRHRERLTLDLNLQFRGERRSVELPGLAIAEVKQHGTDRRSAFVQEMRVMSIRPIRFSKYCIGVSMLYDDIKHNNFKPELLRILKLTGGVHNA